MIHKTAIIDVQAKLDKNVKIGPYCVIGSNVEIGENTIIQSHVSIFGNTKIGKGNKIYPFVSINDPQDSKYKGEPTNLIIGDNNKIREYVTINPGTIGGCGKTVVGNNCLFMISSHVAHDCHVGNNVIIANNVPLGGHAIIEDNVIIGAASGGPFLKFSKKSLDKIKIKDALNHPTWKMGQKISIDSATMINKVYEVIEAKKIFDLEYSKIDILIQPTSYVHSIIEFMNGTTHILAHKPTMKIPIFNSILKESVYENKVDTLIDYNFMNNLQLQKVPSKIFPIKKILNLIPENDSLFETILVSANDTLVELFLTKKIPFNKIHSLLDKVLKKKEFHKYRLKKPKNINEITNLYEYVRLKTKSLSVL